MISGTAAVTSTLTADPLSELDFWPKVGAEDLSDMALIGRPTADNLTKHTLVRDLLHKRGWLED